MNLPTAESGRPALAAVRAPRRAALLALALAASAAAPARAADKPRTRLALISLATGEGISRKSADVVEEALLNALARTGRFQVVGRSDVASLIGFEREKQLAGCSDDTSCAAEIAGALGVPYVGAASMGRLGRYSVVSLKIIEVSKARVVARCEERMKSEDDIADALDRLSGAAVAACETEGCFAAARPPEPVPEPKPAPPAALAPAPVPPAPVQPAPAPVRRWRTLAWTLAAVGFAAAAGGAVVGWQSRGITGKDVTAADGTHSITQAEMARAATLAKGADALFAVAGVAGAAGVVLFVFP